MTPPPQRSSRRPSRGGHGSSSAAPALRDVHQFLQTTPVREAVDAWGKGAKFPDPALPRLASSEEKARYSDSLPAGLSPAQVLTWARINGRPAVERDERRRRVLGGPPLVPDAELERQSNGLVADPTQDYLGDIALKFRRGSWWAGGVSVVTTRSWLGRVVAVAEDRFVAKLWEPAVGPDQKQAEILIESLPEADRKLVTPGALFTWFVGYREDGGTRTDVSEIQFRRGPARYSNEEWEAALERAGKRLERLEHAVEAADASDAAYRDAVERG